MSSNDELFIRIGAYVDGELPESERDAVENLVATSREYGGAAETFQWLDQLAGSGAVPSVSADEWVAVKDGALRRAREEVSRGERAAPFPRSDRSAAGADEASRAADVVPIAGASRWTRIGALAAAVIVCASIGIAVLNAPDPGASPDHSSGGNTGSVGPGQADADAIEHLGGPRPKIEVDEDSSSVYYEDF